VLEWEERGASRRYVLAARGTGKRPRLLLISDDARLVRLGPERLPEDAAVVGRIDLPTPFRPRDPKYRRRVAESLRSWTPTAPPARPHLPVDDPVGVASCPDLQAHLRAAREARRLQKTLERERRRLQGLAAGVVPRFHEILRILERWGCVRGWSLTPAGERLRTIYNELDLLLGESLERGLLDGLDAAEVAAVASLFTYEPRRADDPGTLPTRRCADRAERVAEMWDELAQAESRAGLTVSRMPEAGFAGIAYRWASGEGLESLFAEDAVGVGDFVRNCRQLIDLLRQIRDAAPRLRDVVENALDAVDRGVVAAVGVT
jgi:ATP-dependent RNA helicase HelY